MKLKLKVKNMFVNIKKILVILVIIFLSMNTFATTDLDDDEAAFITKSEFDSLTAAFNDEMNDYMQGIDRLIDNSIALYLSGIEVVKDIDTTLDLYSWMTSYGANKIDFNWNAIDEKYNEQYDILSQWTIALRSFHNALENSEIGVEHYLLFGYKIKDGKPSNLVGKYHYDNGKYYISGWDGDCVVTNISDIYLYILSSDVCVPYITKFALNSNTNFALNQMIDMNGYTASDFQMEAFFLKDDAAGDKYWSCGYPNQKTAVRYSVVGTQTVVPTLDKVMKVRNLNKKILSNCYKFPIKTTTTKAYSDAHFSCSEFMIYPDSSTIIQDEDLWEKKEVKDVEFTRYIFNYRGPSNYELGYNTNVPGNHTDKIDYSFKKDSYYVPKILVKNYEEVYDKWVYDKFGVDNSLAGPAPLYSARNAGKIYFQITPSVEGKFYITEKPNLNIYDSSLYTSSNLTQFKAASSEAGLNTASYGTSYQTSSKAYFMMDVREGAKYYIFFVPTILADVSIVPEKIVSFRKS